jgi:hypothetical protein
LHFGDPRLFILKSLQFNLSRTVPVRAGDQLVSLAFLLTHVI